MKSDFEFKNRARVIRADLKCGVLTNYWHRHNQILNVATNRRAQRIYTNVVRAFRKEAENRAWDKL